MGRVSVVQDGQLVPAGDPQNIYGVVDGSLVRLNVRSTDEVAEPGQLWPTMKLVAAASDGGTGSNTWPAFLSIDSDLATAVGEATPFVAGQHSYSGNNFPATFAQTTANNPHLNGWNYSVLNVKCDWTQLAGGGMDSHITNFISSIPDGHKVYLIINHEPENDSNPAGHVVWCSGQARAANLIASLDDPRCEYAVCHMTYTWKPASGRNPQDWNPVSGGTISMTTQALDRAIFAPDGYTKVRNTSGTDIDSMAEEFDDCFEAGISWGFSRFAISEHSLNNDLSAPVSQIVNWWQTDHLPYLRAKNLVYYAIYNSEGPASGTNSKLDTPEELDIIGNFIKEYKYPQ